MYKIRPDFFYSFTHAYICRYCVLYILLQHCQSHSRNHTAMPYSHIFFIIYGDSQRTEQFMISFFIYTTHYIGIILFSIDLFNQKIETPRRPRVAYPVMNKKNLSLYHFSPHFLYYILTALLNGSVLQFPPP